MTRPNAELVAEVFPGVATHGDLGENTTLLSIDKARRLLGFDPQLLARRALTSGPGATAPGIRA